MCYNILIISELCCYFSLSKTVNFSNCFVFISRLTGELHKMLITGFTIMYSRFKSGKFPEVDEAVNRMIN